MELARPRVDPAEDAAVGLFETRRIERAFDGVSLEIDETDGDSVCLEPIQGRLVANVFEVAENIGAWISVRVVRKRAHATAAFFAR